MKEGITLTDFADYCDDNDLSWEVEMEDPEDVFKAIYKLREEEDGR